MALFHKQSKLERLVEPVSQIGPKGAAKSGLTALGAMVGMSLLSSAVTVLRQRKEEA